YGAIWLRLSTSGPFVHTAFFDGRLDENSIVRMQDVLAAVREWIPQWEERTAYGGHRGIVGIGAVNGGFAWRVSRTPHRTELYVTAPGSEIAESHPLVAAIEEGHEAVFGSRPERDVVRWFSDASALTRYGIESVNYGTSSGLPDPVLGENLDIEGLVRVAKVYALVAARICEVA